MLRKQLQRGDRYPVLIGGDTILRDNPPSYPVQNGPDVRDTPAIVVSVPLPTSII